MKLKDIKTYVLLDNLKVVNAYYDKATSQLRNFKHNGHGVLSLVYNIDGKTIISKVINTSDNSVVLIKLALKIKEARNENKRRNIK